LDKSTYNKMHLRKAIHMF